MMVFDERKSNVYSAKEGYNIWASKYDETLKLLDSFEKGHFLSMIGDLRGKKVVDFGAGTGRMTEELLKNGASVVALDMSKNMLEILNKKYPLVKTVECDVCNCPLDDESIDLAVASFLIVHLKNPKLFFREVYRVLKTGGEFVLSNINQRKSPKLRLNSGKDIVIKSFYHRPQDIISYLEDEFFEILEEVFVEEKGNWINQIIKCKK